MVVVNGKTDPNFAFRKRQTTAKIQSLDGLSVISRRFLVRRNLIMVPN
jgi:hypothetical protein